MSPNVMAALKVGVVYQSDISSLIIGADLSQATPNEVLGSRLTSIPLSAGKSEGMEENTQVVVFRPGVFLSGATEVRRSMDPLNLIPMDLWQLIAFAKDCREEALKSEIIFALGTVVPGHGSVMDSVAPVLISQYGQLWIKLQSIDRGFKEKWDFGGVVCH